MALTSNYSSGTDYNQNMPVDPGYLGTPIYQQTSGALSSTQPSSTVPVNPAAAPIANTAAPGMATGASGAALPPQINAPVTDYTQLPQYLKDFDVGNRPQSGWLGQGPNPQYAANGVNDFNKLSGMYGNDAAMNPYFQTDAFKNDPRYGGLQVTNPFSTYDTGFMGFAGKTSKGLDNANFYAPGQGFNPINGQYAQGGGVYSPTNGQWNQQSFGNLWGNVGQYFGGNQGQYAPYNGNAIDQDVLNYGGSGRPQDQAGINQLQNLWYGAAGGSPWQTSNYYPNQLASQQLAQQYPGGPRGY